MIRIAIPVFKKRVSPIFDTCTRLAIIDFDDHKEVSRQEVSLENFSTVERFNLLKKMDVHVLICCAISEEMDHMINGLGLQLISGIVGNVNKVLNAYFNNYLDDPSFHMPGY